ncbi:phosphonate metabolism transcriptional regulator PhnF [Neobacillus piezotolerans]|uniref:Phosphonate metabolism transcriptional regulator PhnF n=1 Tax=Neobacillus piezotolerans TaxID=2259171 RepID=A0A3D8GT83_9BACI|nr:GntR family transcriptional regulator [Neobacillus piezotolerans]RDU37673.1 phosphonate metabolism transcriptional regulator PhnF [Neobacillus piezotolerans]
MVNKKSSIPLYFQLEELIRQEIAAGSLKPGDSIPSEREYAELHEISRMTVRQAINNLVSAGILYRQKGKGTFVSTPKIEQELFGLTGFTEDMVARGMKPENRLLSFAAVSANQAIADALSVQENELLYEIKRIRLADGIPMAIETVYMPKQLVPGLTENQTAFSVYSYIEDVLGLTILDATQEIEASAAGPVDAGHLGIKEGSPILLITRTSRLGDGTPFEYVQSAFRADRYKFIHNLRRSGK